MIKWLYKKYEHEEEVLSFHYLLKGMMDTFHEILRGDLYEYGMRADEIKHRIEYKKLLRKSLRSCVMGDHCARVFIIDCIKDFLIKKYRITEESIHEIVIFHDKRRMDGEQKFRILLYAYEKDYGEYALEAMFEKFHLTDVKYTKEGEDYYEITSADIHITYDSWGGCYLSFNDKLNILSQMIYERYRGNGIIDILCRMNIDGVSAGVSGAGQWELQRYTAEEERPAAYYDSVWIFFKGNSIHLSFLSFKSSAELIRVCKNICRNQHQGQLSEASGYTVTELMDGSRASVARPPFCESWILIIRKFNQSLQKDIASLIKDDNWEQTIELMKWIVQGCQVVGITGEQGSGKTSLLVALISFIRPSLNLRIQELSFELHLRSIYPRRNIITFRETASVSGQEGLDFQKKTDGAVNILGEVSTAPLSAWLVQMSQTASLFTMFTHHAKTSENLVFYLRNALLLEGGFSNELAAEQQVVDCVRFDIHMAKLSNGHRYIERITEIIPCSSSSATALLRGKYTDGQSNNNNLFELRDIITWNQGRYCVTGMMSRRTREDIASKLSESSRGEFLEQMRNWEAGVYERG